MDGKFKVFTLEDLQAASLTNSLNEKFFVEVPYGVTCAEHIVIDGSQQEYLIGGLDDGTVQLFDYTKHKAKSVQRPVFRIQKDTTSPGSEDRPADLDHPYDNFQETLYEHSASVTAIEKNYKDQSLFATAGRDSFVFIWRLAGDQGKDDVEFITEIGKDQLNKNGGSSLDLGYVTSMKWYDENVLAMSLSNGTIQMNDIRIKQGQGADSICSPNNLTSKTVGAIWDTALWRESSGVKIISAEDSGRITLTDPRMAGSEPIVLTVCQKLSQLSFYDRKE